VLRTLEAIRECGFGLRITLATSLTAPSFRESRKTWRISEPILPSSIPAWIAAMQKSASRVLAGLFGEAAFGFLLNEECG